MGPRPENDRTLLKGAVTFALDEMSRRSDARSALGALKLAIESLKPIGYANLEVALEKFLLHPIFSNPAKSEAAAGHLKRFWFDQKSSDLYFSKEQPISEIFALGVVKCLEISLQHAPDPLPIDAWWMVDHGRFELLNLVSDYQVTLLFATPRPTGTPGSNVAWGSREAWSTSRSEVASRRLGS